ncbi:uncharacterized protein LOC113359600 [Papaver somniferum]|uniref:uncharacterized protein LOC113359600 n=1 Tax=Papaver somniferum TaxID=3469 RepID=UPI000E6FFDB4|nr:uncharacterized protein LOC113359600 [Papaver somniferum]
MGGKQVGVVFPTVGEKIVNQSELVFGSIPRRYGIPKWYEMLGSQKDDVIQEDLPYSPPGMVDGAKLTVFYDEEIAEDVNRCEDLVVGCFVGKRLPFLLVKFFVQRAWKLKADMNMTLHGDSMFVFEFNSAEDRSASLQQGCLFISGQPFVVRPWSLLIVQELAELKTIPIWINMRNVPLHLWNAKGLGKLASFIDAPLLLDKKISTRSRTPYARVCVEVTVDSDLPSHIDALVGKTKIQIHVEYNWKPQKCAHCAVFGHSQDKCVAASNAAKEAASRVMASNLEKNKNVGGDGWMVKNLKRGRGKNFNKENIAQNIGGASSNGTSHLKENSLVTHNRFNQLVENSARENMEGVVQSVVQESNTALTPINLGSGTSNNTSNVVQGTDGNSLMYLTDGSGFVQTQVDKLDVVQHEGEMAGARAHFLPKSSTQSKNLLNMKAAEKKSGKIKKSNPSHG